MAVEATGLSLGAIEIGLSAAVKRDGSRPLPRGPSRRRGGHVDDFGLGHPPRIGGGHRPGEPEALAKLAAEQAQRGRLLLGFDMLGNARQSHRAAQVDHALQ